MHLLTYFILSIYLKYVKVDELTFIHNGTDHVTNDGALAKEDGYYAYNLEDEDGDEVHYMNIRIITKLEFRTAVKDERRFWVDGIVPYVISKKYDSKETNVILEGMQAFNRDTCIRFIPRTKELVYITVAPGVGCSATVGKFDKNGVKISAGCYKKGIVIHELMHVLGFLHEQSRPDRDSFVTINYDNILEKHKKNFDKLPQNRIQTGNVSYDYGSIMHYGPFTFAKNKDVQTVIPLEKGVEIGQREDFSKIDLEKINLFYNCKPQGRRRIKRNANHESVADAYYNKQESSLPVVVDPRYVERRKSVPASFQSNFRMENYGPVRSGGEYPQQNYGPVQNPRQVYHPQAYPSSGYSLEERRRSSYPSAAYPPAIPETYQWPSYSAVEHPKLVYPQAEQPKRLYAPAEQPQLVYPQAEQPKIVYPQEEPPRLPNRQYLSSRPAYSPVEYRRENYYRPTYPPGQYRVPYPPMEYPKPVYERPSYTTAEYRRPQYPPPYYRPVEYPSIDGYYPVDKPYTQPFTETTVLIIDPLTQTTPTTTEEGSTTVMTTTPLTTDNTTPTLTETSSVTTESTTLQTTPIDTTTSASTVTETTTVITTEGTSTVVTSTTAETTTLEPTSTVTDATTTDPPSTVTETTTALPTSTVTETTTAVPTSTVTETTTAVPTSTVTETTTAVPTSTVTETMTAVPTSTVTETTTAVPTSTVTETTTEVPTSTVTETTTAMPTSTVTETTTAMPTSTVTETTTALTTEVTSTVVTTTQEITSTLFTTVETTTNEEITNATGEDIGNNRSTTMDYEYMPEQKYEYYELQSRGMGGFVSDRDIHSTAYHRIRIFPNVQGRTALRDPSAFWRRGVVPYEFSDKYEAQQKRFLLEAMQEFHNKTCVRFVPRRNQASYIFIEPEIKCSATIGRVPGGVNKVKISEGCYLQGTIIHELMHTLGFVHEQNRPDRDQYVIVIFDNIIPDATKNFRKYTWDEVQDFGVGYDYNSVMHYSNVEFAIDPDRPTLVPLQAGVMLGQRDGFSRKDLIKINKLYKCRVIEAKEAALVLLAKEAATVSPIEDFRKYFQSNIVRLFRNLLRAIQNFKPSKPKTT